MEILDCLLLFEERRKGRAPKVKRVDQLRRAIEDNDLANPPGWLAELFLALRDCEHRSLGFNEVGSDASSFLQEVAEILGWEYDDYGEGILILFRNLNLKIFISRESLDQEGKGCASFAIGEFGST